LGGEHLVLADDELMGEVKCTQTDDFWIFEDEKRYGCLFDNTGRPVDWLQIPLRSGNKNLAVGNTKMCYQSIPQIVFQSHTTYFPIIGKLDFIGKKNQAQKRHIIDKNEQIRIGRLYHLPGYNLKTKDYALSEKLASRNHAVVNYDKDKDNFYIENVSKNNMIIVFSEGIMSKAEFIESGHRYFLPSGSMAQVWIGHTIFELRDPREEVMKAPEISEHPTLLKQ